MPGSDYEKLLNLVNAYRYMNFIFPHFYWYPLCSCQWRAGIDRIPVLGLRVRDFWVEPWVATSPLPCLYSFSKLVYSKYRSGMRKPDQLYSYRYRYILFSLNLFIGGWLNNQGCSFGSVCRYKCLFSVLEDTNHSMIATFVAYNTQP
jgi:hypothetical protein